MNKKLKEKYLQDVEDIRNGDHNLMSMLYFVHYKLYDKDCMVVGGVPVKNNDFNCFLQYHRDYLRHSKKFFFDKDIEMSIRDEAVVDMLRIIRNLQEDELYHRIIQAMEITENYNYYDFIDYLKEHPFAETRIIAEHKKNILEKQVEDLRKEIKELQYGCPHTETIPFLKDSKILTGSEELRAEKNALNEWVKIYE